jgi:N-acetylmuramoyl-L-alanine amidase
MKIGLRGGHSPNCKGAMGIIDEQAEVRKIYNEMVPMLQAAGHTVINCNSDASTMNAELSEGTNKANSNNCDIYVTIHMNASGGAGNGTEVWMYNGNNSSMNSIASRICQHFASKGFQNRGVKYNTGYHDLNASSMPAMIVEALFCDNTKDAGLYRSVGVNGIAKLIAEGITGSTVDINKVPDKQPTERKVTTMQCFYKITDLDKDKVYYFDGFTAHPLNHPDEKKVLNDIYKANNGKDMPEFKWTSKAPWYGRLKDAVSRASQFVIKK